jgi:hypothetical protein
MAPSILAQLVLGHGQSNSSIHLFIFFFHSRVPGLRWSWCEFKLVNVDPDRRSCQPCSVSNILYMFIIICRFKAHVT